ncbi:hypothetical protein QBC35DRAFT_178980 [Podospora australis]|uniref:F5/8 type C domain-containing protein n=1 Tax=Podospora australis TaxID=1536484 RepID=A0AAN7ABB5_9PEZI|nr:hypothetical protein QBC35DRAFT_178980 [Podospora australis]
MFNARRFFYEAVVLSEPDGTSDSKSLLPVSLNDVEKNTSLPSLPRAQNTPEKSRHSSFVVKAVCLTSFFAFVIFLGQPVANFAVLAYNAVLHCSKPHHHEAQNISQQPIVDEPFFPAAIPWGAETIKDRSGWKVVNCSSSEDSTKTGCDKAIDNLGDQTDWKSATQPGSAQWIEIDLGNEVNIHSLEVQPSKNLRWKGVVRKHRVDVRAASGDWQTVARGTWRDTRLGARAIFEPRPTRFVRLWVADTHQDTSFVAISDIVVWTLSTSPVTLPNGGRWTDTLDFPLVPVTAWLNPKTGRLVTLASYTNNHFDQGQNAKKTVQAEWDPAKDTITERIIAETEHDAFCPGTSMDEIGRVFLTGGSTPEIYSIYDPTSSSDPWVKPTNNRVAKKRGYQGQTYLPDGRTFMIGGTWSGGSGDEDKPGEIYDTNTRTWTLFPEAYPANSIRMDKSQCSPPSGDSRCVKDEWRQHHPWLFAWKGNTVFHAGPSKRMNWFHFAKGNEKTVYAGLRQDASDKSNIFADGDAVCGAAVMYDAVSGSILTAGGAPNYHYWLEPWNMPNSQHRLPATNNVFGITLGTPGDEVKPKRLASMKYPRIFANAVIFPNGEVFVAGGQRQGEPFYDESWVDTPEIYTPATNTWRTASANSIPRAYHSWAQLLPDATVLVGGGGLEMNHENVNHYDAQIYQPAYLLTPDGRNTVPRPKIKDDDRISEYKLGTKFEIQTDVPVDLDASLIRYSPVTHALNNDLRRIPLKLVPQGNPTDKKYQVEIPADPGVALPGYWMLFVLQKGVPSHAKTVRIFK